MYSHQDQQLSTSAAHLYHLGSVCVYVCVCVRERANIVLQTWERYEKYKIQDRGREREGNWDEKSILRTSSYTCAHGVILYNLQFVI